jgi:hypothetical protein
MTVCDAVKVARHDEAPYPAGLKEVANSNQPEAEVEAAAETSVEDAVATETPGEGAAAPEQQAKAPEADGGDGTKKDGEG